MALKSMTGYGRSSLQAEGVEISVEILSVNRKHLDINIAMPKHFVRFDPAVRRLLASQIFRGHVTLRIGVILGEEALCKIRANLPLARELYAGWKQIAAEFSSDESVVLPFTLFQNEPELFSYEETSKVEELGPLLLQAVEAALKPFLAMRECEGSLLKKDFSMRLASVRDLFKNIENLAGEIRERYREKLLSRLREVLPTIAPLDERLLKEIALYAEKIDIEEEVLRFHSHLDQLEKLFSQGGEVVGKTAEFWLQELSREINTIGSKALDIAVVKTVVDIKAELERVREQIQNVE